MSGLKGQGRLPKETPARLRRNQNRLSSTNTITTGDGVIITNPDGTLDVALIPNGGLHKVSGELGVQTQGVLSSDGSGVFLSTGSGVVNDSGSLDVVIDGTAASTPSPYVSGDADTGLVSLAADTLGLVAGGENGITLYESGGGTWIEVTPSDSETFDWTDGGVKPASAALRVGLDGNGNGIQVQESDAGGANIFFGCYNRFGAARFVVANSGITFGLPFTIASQAPPTIRLGGFTNFTNLTDRGTLEVINAAQDSHGIGIINNSDSTRPVMYFASEVSNAANEAGFLHAEWANTPTAANGSDAEGRLRFVTRGNNTNRDALVLEADGAEAKIGLYGVTAVGQQAHIADVPTGGSADVGDNATAINSILSALENIGITATS